MAHVSGSWLLAGGLLWAAQASPQTIVSLRAGLVSYVEGRVLADDLTRVSPRVSYHLREGHELQTRSGRAELLLMPAVFLRLGEDSSITLDENSVNAPQVTLNRGAATIEVVQIPRGDVVRLRLGDTITEIRAAGHYRIEAAGGGVKVFTGKAVVLKHQPVQLKAGQEIRIAAAVTPVKFDRKQSDRLQRWSSGRTVSNARSNMVLARSLHGPSWRRMTSPWLWSVRTMPR